MRGEPRKVTVRVSGKGNRSAIKEFLNRLQQHQWSVTVRDEPSPKLGKFLLEVGVPESDLQLLRAFVWDLRNVLPPGGWVQTMTRAGLTASAALSRKSSMSILIEDAEQQAASSTKARHLRMNV